MGAPHRPFKMAQTFWALDADTDQPLCFTTGTGSRSAIDATPQLMDTVITNDGLGLSIKMHLQHLHYTGRTNGSERSWSIADGAAKVKCIMAV